MTGDKIDFCREMKGALLPENVLRSNGIVLQNRDFCRPGW